jgi:hypothetical protein
MPGTGTLLAQSRRASFVLGKYFRAQRTDRQVIALSPYGCNVPTRVHALPSSFMHSVRGHTGRGGGASFPDAQSPTRTCAVYSEDTEIFEYGQLLGGIE